MSQIARSVGIALVFVRAFLGQPGTFAGDVPSGSGADPPSTATIVVSNCPIKFIDEVVLASQRFGVIDWIIAEGAHVKRNQPVLRLDDRAVRATVAIVEEQARNDVEVRYARKVSQLAQIAYLRSTALNQKLPGSVTDLTLREERLTAEKSLLQLEEAEHNFEIGQLKLRESRQNLETFQVVAPFDGLVRKIHKKRSEAVHEGEPIVELVSTARVSVEGLIKFDQFDRLAVGTPVEVALEGADGIQPRDSHTYPGWITFVDVKVEPLTRTLRVAATVDNRDNRLRDGLSARLTIFTDSQRIPTTAGDLSPGPGLSAEQTTAGGRGN